ERRGLPGDEAVQALQVFASVQPAVGFAEQDDVAPRGSEHAAERRRRVFYDADNADDGGRVDGGAVGFVVEADIAAGDGHVERTAGLGNAFDGLHELPHDLGLLRV